MMNREQATKSAKRFEAKRYTNSSLSSGLESFESVHAPLVTPHDESAAAAGRSNL